MSLRGRAEFRAREDRLTGRTIDGRVILEDADREHIGMRTATRVVPLGRRHGLRVTAGIVLASVFLLLGAADAARAPGALPNQIPPADRTRLEQITRNAVVSTRMEAAPYTARASIFEYLLDHPDFASHVTKALKLARYQIWRTKDGLFLDDGWGAKGDFAVVYAAPGTRVMYAKGRFEPTLLPDIHGQAVVILEYDFRPQSDGRTLVATAVTGYVILANRLFALAGSLAGPIVQAKADKEARRLLKVFADVSRAIDERPQAVYEQLRQRPGVPPRELEEFRQLLDRP